MIGCYKTGRGLNKPFQVPHSALILNSRFIQPQIHFLLLFVFQVFLFVPFVIYFLTFYDFPHDVPGHSYCTQKKQQQTPENADSQTFCRQRRLQL